MTSLVSRILPVAAGIAVFSAALDAPGQEEASGSNIQTGAKVPEKVEQKQQIRPVKRTLPPLLFSDSEEKTASQKMESPSVAPTPPPLPQSAVEAVPAGLTSAETAPGMSREERIASLQPPAPLPTLGTPPSPAPPASDIATVTPVDSAKPEARVAPATVPMAGSEVAPVPYPYERPEDSAPVAMPNPPPQKTRSIAPTLPGSKLLEAMGISIEDDLKKVGNEAATPEAGDLGPAGGGLDEIPSPAPARLANGRVMTAAHAGEALAPPSFPAAAGSEPAVVGNLTQEELKATSKVYSAVTSPRTLPDQETTAENPYPRPQTSVGQTHSSISPVIPRSRKLEEMGIDLSPFARIRDINEPDPIPGSMANQTTASEPESWAPPGSDPGGAYAAVAAVQPAPSADTIERAADAAGAGESYEGMPMDVGNTVGREAGRSESEEDFPIALAGEDLPTEDDWDESGTGPGLELPSYDRNDDDGRVGRGGEKRGWSLLASFWKRGDGDSGHAGGSSEGNEVAALVTEEEGESVSSAEGKFDGMTRFPAIDMPDLQISEKEKNIDWLIERVAGSYAAKVSKLNSVDVSLDIEKLPAVPEDFDAAWAARIHEPVWPEGTSVKKEVESVYASALSNSHQIAALSDIPLIRETAIQEAQGAYDFNAFLEGRYAHTNEPTGSLLTTGERGRFLQDQAQAEYGVKKTLKSGAEVSLSNRLSTLDSNSEFLDPNPQGGSELVVSVSQPLLKGAGYDYNTTALKVAKLDAKMGMSEFLRQLEAYLLEISRTYWGVYLARAGYLQKVYLVDRTQEIVSQLEDRAKVDEKATASELLRARSALAERRARLIRSEMAIRIAEERLRALVNDPSFHLGSNVEVIPQTRPILGPPAEDVREVAELAIANRPELLEGIYQVQAAGLRRDLSKNELMPTLDLILEGTVAGIEEGRDVGNAWTNQFDRGGPGWLVGVKFEVPWERNFAKARDTRRKHELRQQVNQLRSTMDSVMLEAVVAYQELRTSYRDMQGKYQAVMASREELAELEARLDVEAGEEGKSVGYQLQLILDAIERNEQAEEAFLVSLVVYNTAFTTLDRARGTLLRKHGVTFDRTVGRDGLEKIESSVGGMDADVE